MYYFPSALARQPLAALSAGLILALSSNVASSAENCERLEAGRSILGRRTNQGAEATQAENGNLVLDALYSSCGSLSLTGLETPLNADASGQARPLMPAPEIERRLHRAPFDYAVFVQDCLTAHPFVLHSKRRSHTPYASDELKTGPSD
jgi:hypothetical protein